MTGKINDFQVKGEMFEPLFNKYNNKSTAHIDAKFDDISYLFNDINKIGISLDKKVILEFVYEFGSEVMSILLNGLGEEERYKNIIRKLENKQTNKEHLIGTLGVYSLINSFNNEINKIVNSNIFHLIAIIHNIKNNHKKHNLGNNNKSSKIEKIRNLWIRNVLKDNAQIDYINNLIKLYMESKGNFSNIEVSLFEICHEIEIFIFLLYNYKEIDINKIKKKYSKIIKYCTIFNEKFNFDILSILGLSKEVFSQNTSIENIKDNIDQSNLFLIKNINIKNSRS